MALTARRREMLKLTGLAALGMAPTVAAPAMAQQTLAWDKTFPKSDRVDHRKVSYTNGWGSPSLPTWTSRGGSNTPAGIRRWSSAHRSAP